MGPRDAADFEAYLLTRGATVMPPLEVRFRQTSTLAEVIARLEHNVFARPSGIDPTALRRSAAGTRAWTREQVGPLDEPQPSERVITYRIYQLRQ